MFSTYKEALAYFDTKKAAGIRFDLTRMAGLMERLRHPERRVKTIHVAGTNGKGSTVTYLQSILKEGGFFSGTFMSPVLGDPREQIAINGESMPESDFMEVLTEIYPVVVETEQDLQELVSEFELITAMALYYFSFKKAVDLAIIEAGMGGRNDATNVITPLVSIITNVTLEHKDYLGDTIAEIAFEKAGIIKSGVPVMTACDEEALQVLIKEAKLKHTKTYTYQSLSLSTEVKDNQQQLTYNTPYRNLTDISLGMVGEHQAINAALAIMTVDYLKQYYALMIEDDHIKQGLNQAKLPGRFERSTKNPLIIFDTAHNPDAIQKTVNTVKKLYGEKDVDTLFATMNDKDVSQMLSILSELSDTICVSSFDSLRALPISGFEAYEKRYTLELVAEPMQWMKERERQKESNLLLVTGSHLFVSEMRQQYLEFIKSIENIKKH